MRSATGEWNGSGSRDSNCIGRNVPPARASGGMTQTFFSGDVASQRAGRLAIARISVRSRAMPKVAAWNSPVARLAFMLPTSIRKSAGNPTECGADDPVGQFG